MFEVRFGGNKKQRRSFGPIVEKYPIHKRWKTEAEETQSCYSGSVWCFPWVAGVPTGHSPLKRNVETR